MYTSDQRLWLTEDKSRVVPDGDPAARFLLVGEGGELPDDVAAQYKLPKRKAAKVADADAPAEPEGDTKALTEPPHTKALTEAEATK